MGRRAGEQARSTRRRVLATAGGVGIGAAAGCAGVGEFVGDGRSGTTTIELVEVAGARSRETFDPVVEELERERNETVELEFNEVPYENMRSQLQTRVGGGNPPDVAAIDQIWLGRFVDGSRLLELDEVADEVDVEDYLDAFVDAATSDGHLYAVPTTTDVRGMYWDRAAFADAGLDPARPPETWADLLDAAEQVHDPPDRYGSAYFVAGGRWTVNLFAAGGRVLNEDGTEPRFQEAPGVAAAEFVDEIYNGRAVGPPNPQYQDSSRLAREFLQGQYAITVVEGSWLDYFWRNLGNENDEMVERFGFAPTPRPAAGEVATMSGGHLWAGFRDADHPDVVQDFLRIAASREFNRHVALDAGEIPTRASLLDDDEVWAGMLYGDVVRDLLADARLRPIRNWSTVAKHLDPALQRVAFDRDDPGEALQVAADRVRSEL